LRSRQERQRESGSIFTLKDDKRSKSRLPFYHPELDILRLAAFSMVFVYHALPGSPALYVKAHIPATMARLAGAVAEGGRYGVDLFFALSAYLITTILLREYRERGTVEVKAFYLRRILRIWPLYLLVLAVGPPLAHLLSPTENFPMVYLLGFLLFSGNWVCAVKGLPVSSLVPLWSVSIEEQFYMAWPLVIRRWGHSLHYVCSGLLGVACLARIYVLWQGAEYPAMWCSTLTRLDPIALGALLAFVLKGSVPSLSKMMRFGLVSAGFALIVMVGWRGPEIRKDALWSFPLVAAASVAMIAGTLRPAASFRPRKTIALLVYLGRISYGLYVFHVFALSTAELHILHGFGRLPLKVVTGALLTVLLAAASYRFVERPFLDLKKKFTYMPVNQ
jgi:peptidoglycan/LPS O-acetylase OafA/YrhL